jgi:hypothetical protein
VASHVLVTASLIPIHFVEIMQPRLKKVERISAGHPPTPLRVRLVREYLKSIDVSTADFEEVFRAYEHDYSQKLGEMEENDREDVTIMGSQAERLLSPLAPMIASKVNALGLRRFRDQNAQRARALRVTLESRQPISSMRTASDEEISIGLNALEAGESTPEQAYEILTMLDEMPVAASEILAAGWLYRLSTFERELSRAFPDTTGQHTDLSAYAEYVAKTDGLLLKSLELVAVHTEVRHRLTRT